MHIIISFFITHLLKRLDDRAHVSIVKKSKGDETLRTQSLHRERTQSPLHSDFRSENDSGRGSCALTAFCEAAGHRFRDGNCSPPGATVSFPRKEVLPVLISRSLNAIENGPPSQ